MPNSFSYLANSLSPTLLKEIEAAYARGDIIVVDYPDSPPPMKRIDFDTLATMAEMKKLVARHNLAPIQLPKAPTPRLHGKWRDSQGNKPRR